MRFTILLLFLLTTFFACQETKTLSIPNEEGLKSINGTELYCKIIGIGEPILIVHGGPGMSHDYFLPHMEELAKEHTLIFYDHRASGQSSASLDSTGISLDLFLADIEAIREMYGIEQLNLLGHSWGGLLAMYYALEYPEHLGKLILSNATPASSALQRQDALKSAEKRTEVDSLAQADVMGSEAFQNGDAKAYEELFKLFFKNEFANPYLVEQLNLNFPEHYVQNGQLLRYLGKDLMEYDLHEDLKDILVPTMVIYGEAESSKDSGEKMAEQIPNAQFEILKDCGHFPFVEQPTAYFALIQNFIGS